MSSIEPTRVVRPRSSLTGARDDSVAAESRDLPQRRLAGAHAVLLSGPSLVDNSWLIDKLTSQGYHVVRHRSLKEAPSVLERDPALIALIEASVPRQAEALEIIRGLDHRCRRRVLVIVWRQARRMVRQFIEAGAGDFLTLPPPPSGLLLRVELRAREGRTSLFAERAELRNTLPEVNHLNGAIGPESSNVRLSDREFLLYDMLSQRFGTVVPRAEILSRIWGRGSGGEP